MQKAVEVQNGDTPEVLQRQGNGTGRMEDPSKAIDLIANGKVDSRRRNAIVKEYDYRVRRQRL